MIVAWAIAAGADYVVTRDKDILLLDYYKGCPAGAALEDFRERKEGDDDKDDK